MSSEPQAISSDSSERALSPWWRHAVILVMAFGFSLLTLVTVLTYSNAPPIPERVTGRRRGALHAGEHRAWPGGLPQVRPHGARHALGPRRVPRSGLHRRVPAPPGRDRAGHAGPRASRPARTRELDPETQRAALDGAVQRQLKQNRYDAGTARSASRRPRRRPAQAQKEEWADYFSGDNAGRRACPRSSSRTPGAGGPRLRTSRGPRGRRSPTGRERTTPTRTTGRTSRWSATGPTASTYLWSALSLVTLLGGLGAGAVHRSARFDYLGWKGDSTSGPRHESALARWTLTPEPEGGRALLRGRRAALPAPGARWAARSRTTASSRAASTASTSPASCPTTCCGPGTCSSPSSGSPRRGWRAACSSRRSSAAPSPRASGRACSLLLGALAIVVFGSLFGEWLGSTTGWATCGSGSATRAGSTSTWAASGSCCWPPGSSSGSS